MALMPNKLELAQLKKEAEAKEKTEKRKKQAFIKKFVSALPEKQAEVSWLILSQLQKVEDICDRLIIYNTKF